MDIHEECVLLSKKMHANDANDRVAAIARVLYGSNGVQLRVLARSMTESISMPLAAFVSSFRTFAS